MIKHCNQVWRRATCGNTHEVGSWNLLSEFLLFVLPFLLPDITPTHPHVWTGVTFGGSSGNIVLRGEVVT